MMKETWISV